MNRENTVNKRSQSQKTTYNSIFMTRPECANTESVLTVAVGMGLLLRMSWTQIVVMVAQTCDYTKRTKTELYALSVNLMECELLQMKLSVKLLLKTEGSIK